MNKADVLTPTHPLWSAFCHRLAGALDVQETVDGARHGLHWTCYHDHRHARTILESLPNVDVDASLAAFVHHGGSCDCEILLNMSVSTEPQGSMDAALTSGAIGTAH